MSSGLRDADDHNMPLARHAGNGHEWNVRDVASMKASLIGVMIAAACSTAPQAEGLTAASLAAALREAGFTVRDAGLVEQPFFGVPAHVYVVNEEDVQVYEFGSASEAEQAAAQVDARGSTIGTTKMSWMAPPHFFRRDRLVVNYLGSTDRTLRELERLLGPQFAGH